MRSAATALLVAIGCSSGPAARTPAAPPPTPPHTSAAVAVAVAPADAAPPAAPDPLNLGFEDGMNGWTEENQAGLAEVDTTIVHGGRASLKISTTVGGMTFVLRSLPRDAIADRRLKVTAWARSDGGGFPIMFVGAFGTRRLIEDSRLDQVEGDWEQVTVTLDVPADTRDVQIALSAVSRGQVWFDDLSYTVEDIPEHELVGTVVDPADNPVAGALVTMTAAGDSRLLATTETDADGAFRVRGREGSYAFAATSPAWYGGTLVTEMLPRANVSFDVDSDGTVVRGRVVGRGDPTGLIVTAWEPEVGAHYAAKVDAARGFTIRLPRSTRVPVDVALLAEGWASDAVQAMPGKDVDLVVAASKLEPAPDAAVAWVEKAATPVDRAALKKLVGKARVVGLGMPVYGANEIAALHRDVIAALAAEGFTTVALDVDMAEMVPLARHVRDGTGDPRAAISRLSSFSFRNEATLALVDALRAWNADPANRKRQIELIGADTARFKNALADLGPYLEKVDPHYWAGAVVLAGYPDISWAENADETKRMFDATDDLVAQFAARKKQWIAASSQGEWAEMLEVAEALRRGVRIIPLDAGKDAATVIHQGELLEWLLARRPKERMIFIAHDLFVGFGDGRGSVEVGVPLRRALGKRYVAIGTYFAEGSFLALDGDRGMAPASVGAPDETDVASLFRRAGQARALLDLRGAPKGAVADWLAEPMRLRELLIDGVRGAEDGVPRRLAGRFDAILFVDKVTAAAAIAPPG